MQTSQSCTTLKNQRAFQVKSLLPSSHDRNRSLIHDKTFPKLAEGIGLVHDAGNLLGALSLYADLLAAPKLSSDEPQIYAQEIKHIAERSLTLIERLVNYAGLPSRDSETVVLPEVIADYQGLLSRLVGRRIRVSILTSTYKSVRISREAIERILLNLVKNAAAATPEDGVIHVTVDQSNEEGSRYLVMTVTDNGIGMCESTIEMLKSGDLPPRARGKGFGFQIIRELVTDAGGSIEISSKLGEGTMISVKWPQVNRKAKLRCFQLNKVDVSE